jgi:hypothetical protein
MTNQVRPCTIENRDIVSAFTHRRVFCVAIARFRSHASSAPVSDGVCVIRGFPLPFSPSPLLFVSQHHADFGEGILNRGKAKKREKRPLTQIEIMAAVEREKQEKKAQRRLAKVRHRALPLTNEPCTPLPFLPSQHETRLARDFYPIDSSRFARDFLAFF